MPWKKIAKACLPPGLWKITRRLRDYVHKPEWEYVAREWQGAAPGAQGWQDPSIAETLRKKWRTFLDSTQGPGPLGVNHEGAPGERDDILAHNVIMSYGYVLAMASGGRGKISVLDWGGGIGHYYALSQALAPGLTLDYVCQDLPPLCRLGRELLPQVHFSEQRDACFGRRYDLVLASSSLWYEADWRSTAARMAAAAQKYLYITRMLFIDGATAYVAVQRPWAAGYRTEYRCWILNRREFLEHMERQGMVLLREFALGRGPHIHRAPEQPTLRGYLFAPQGSGTKTAPATGR